jgi:hypothetical protein
LHPFGGKRQSRAQENSKKFWFSTHLFVSLQPEIEYVLIMTATANKIRTRDEILAWLERGRQIKARRLKEAQAKYAERQRRKKEAAESGYYDLEWV